MSNISSLTCCIPHPTRLRLYTLYKLDSIFTHSRTCIYSTVLYSMYIQSMCPQSDWPIFPLANELHRHSILGTLLGLLSSWSILFVRDQLDARYTHHTHTHMAVREKKQTKTVGNKTREDISLRLSISSWNITCVTPLSRLLYLDSYLHLQYFSILTYHLDFLSSFLPCYACLLCVCSQSNQLTD